MSQFDFQALVVVSFGGPEGPDDVMPFLENVTRGRNIPRSRLQEVAHHYELFGGVSPINRQNRALIEALQEELERHGLKFPIYWGNRNWHPFLTDTVVQMQRDGITRALAFVTSAYSSYSSCRQYLEDIERACREAGPGAPVIEKIRPFYNHPGFIQANCERVGAALAEFPSGRREKIWIAFTAHSIPESMASRCTYEAELMETCRLVAHQLQQRRWRLVYQSRSGPPTQPWLEPDVGDYLVELNQAGDKDVVLAPIGFISDHLEVAYDLDTEAGELCRELGMNMVRAGTAGTHPAFVGAIRELIEERIYPGREKRALGRREAAPHHCPAGCCLEPLV